MLGRALQVAGEVQASIDLGLAAGCRCLVATFRPFQPQVAQDQHHAPPACHSQLVGLRACLSNTPSCSSSVAADHAASLTERTPTLETVRSLWSLHRCMLLVGGLLWVVLLVAG